MKKANKNRPPLKAKFVLRGTTEDGAFFRLEKDIVFKRTRVKKSDQNKRAA